MQQEEKDNLSKQISEVKFSWNYQEYVKYEKNITWYVVSLILMALAMAWCFYDKNIPFALFLILFYLTILLYNNMRPEVVPFAVLIDGIKVGKKFYLFREFDHFFIIYEDVGIKNLYLQFRNPFRGRLTVPLDGQNAVEIRRFLLKYLKEDLDREGEPISERLRRWLRL